MTILLAIICLLYTPVLLWLVAGALKLTRFREIDMPPKTAFSVLVPFRNEAENLPDLLGSIQALDYPLELLEVILIDDESADESVAVIREFKTETLEALGLRMSVIQNKRKSRSPKKDAITLGIEQAKFDWIVCTDADCQLPRKWLRLYDQCIQQKKPEMICGPVAYPGGHNLIRTYQLLDGLSLQLVTMAGFGWNRPMLCNGANMGYLKQAFYEVDGYKGNDHIASGDDIFLLAKFRERPTASVIYLNNFEALAETRAERSWKGIIQQRVRWASKTSRQSIGETKFIGSSVFLGNLAFLVAIVWFLMDRSQLIPFSILLGIKIVIDYFVLRVAGDYLKRKVGLSGYLLNVLLYPVITVWVVVRSIGGTYKWKRRTFKK